LPLQRKASATAAVQLVLLHSQPLCHILVQPQNRNAVCGGTGLNGTWRYRAGTGAGTMAGSSHACVVGSEGRKRTLCPTSAAAASAGLSRTSARCTTATSACRPPRSHMLWVRKRAYGMRLQKCRSRRSLGGAASLALMPQRKAYGCAGAAGGLPQNS